MGKKGIGRNFDADRLVTSGLTQEAIGRICGKCGKAWANYYYTVTGQLDLFHASKPGYLNYIDSVIESLFDERFSNLVQIIQTVVYNRATDAEKRTLEFLQSFRETKYSLELLETVYRRYYSAL